VSLLFTVSCFANVGHDNRLPDSSVLGKFPAFTTPALSHYGTEYSDPVKGWTFRKVDWSRFCFLTSRASPGRCGAQCKTWARGPMQDLTAGPIWALILWRHRVQSTVLWSW